MNTKTRIAAMLLVLAAACATTQGGASRSERYRQADTKPPTLGTFDDDAERAYYQEILNHLQRAQIAQTSGNMDQARAEWGAAGEQLGAFADKYQSSEWRITMRYQAAEKYLFAQQLEKAAEQAEKIIVDPQATDASKAMAAHLAAAGWQSVAAAQSKAGKLEPIRLPTAEQRKGEALNPRPPPGPWKRFVVATDTYLQLAEADPELKRPANERRFSAGPSQLALIAAEVEYAFDNMEDARKRFETIVNRWPGEPEVLDSAVPLYLQTFLVTKDDAGYSAAVSKVKELVTSEEAKATDPKQKEAFAKVRDQLARYEQGAGYSAASRLLDAGKSAEAAALFEQFAQEYKESPDAPNALYNASVAWDKANEPEKAAAAREKIVSQYPASKTAPVAQLMLAGTRSRKGKHADAAKLYSEYLTKWPEGANRCVALQNVGYELDVQDKRADAAERYLAFGEDPKCAKDDPNAAAKALYRAGVLFQKAKQKAKAKEAFGSAIKLDGITDTVAKSQVADAKKQLKAL